LLDVKFEGPLEDAKISDKDITWIYRKLWNSYPYEYPRVTFEKIKLGDGLWYTSGMDSFISTMETNALMGRNVARLIVDGWVGAKKVQMLDGESVMHEL
jgi:prenylcysteine oxidase/farnesylcysteine lyase